MYDLTEDMSDNESVTVSSTGMMTPTSTVTGDLTDVEKHEPTITILLKIKLINSLQNAKGVDIKLRQHMPFGNLVQILKTKFDPTEGFVLQMEVPPKPPVTYTAWRVIFDSDTPASVRIIGV
ncbi:hypothetical protein D6D19_07267 [Aureobasidium pullulans]|uniref:Ubiquitin-like domain-containing protein n=1 Tax=Aureobasidium pullulans TaxID=5580 RepID=A0A4S8ZYV0_AURPU|nr:hypothetical protein D6D19_07267 [Aureobasidium pullulans]